MGQPKVDAETAAAEVTRICEAYHVDTDVAHMGDDERRVFEANCSVARRMVMSGSLELGDDGLAVLRAAGKELRFGKPTGATWLAMDKHSGTFAQQNAAASHMVGQDVSGLPAREWKSCMALVNLFL